MFPFIFNHSTFPLFVIAGELSRTVLVDAVGLEALFLLCCSDLGYDPSKQMRFGKDLDCSKMTKPCVSSSRLCLTDVLCVSLYF